MENLIIIIAVSAGFTIGYIIRAIKSENEKYDNWAKGFASGEKWMYEKQKFEKEVKK